VVPIAKRKNFKIWASSGPKGFSQGPSPLEENVQVNGGKRF